MELVSGSLYRIKNPRAANPHKDKKVVVNMAITGTPSISYGFYEENTTQPANLTELATAFPADAFLKEGYWQSTEISNFDYIGFSGTGTVRVMNLDLYLVA